MTNFKTTFFILLLFTSIKTFSQQLFKTGTITLVGNEGFMIESNNKKVLIDALYISSLTNVQNTTNELRQQIINAESPFDSSSLFLVTHPMDDHFNTELVTEYLLKNKQSKLICPDTVCKSFKNDSVKTQLVAETPAKYKSTDTTVDGIEVTTYKLIHKLNNPVYHVGYFIDIDGFKVFHAGDNVMDDTMEYVNYRIMDKSPDVALLNYTSFWKTASQRDFVKRYINPRCIIVMHIPVDKVSIVKQQVAGLDNTFPKVFVLENSLEKIDITDSITRPVVGIKESNYNEFQVYPNPCKDWCNIYTNTYFPEKAYLLSSTGSVIKNFEIINQYTRLDVSGLKHGIYFVDLRGHSVNFIRE
jgi:L-ascorbate metabolism protein UlaG (beta-lactamase superfamily)